MSKGTKAILVSDELMDQIAAQAPGNLTWEWGEHPSTRPSAAADRLVRELTSWLMKSGWIQDYEHARAEAEGFADHFKRTMIGMNGPHARPGDQLATREQPPLPSFEQQIAAKGGHRASGTGPVGWSGRRSHE